VYRGAGWQRRFFGILQFRALIPKTVLGVVVGTIAIWYRLVQR